MKKSLKRLLLVGGLVAVLGASVLVATGCSKNYISAYVITTVTEGAVDIVTNGQQIDD